MPKDSDIKRMINNARKPKGASEVDKILREMTLSTDFSTTIRAYSKVDPPLRDQVSFIRHIQLHLAKFELFVEVEDSVDAEEVLFVKELNSGSIVQEKSNDKLPSFFKGIEADGNCLYRSLAEAVYGEEDRHAQVRMEMMQYLLDNGEKPFARFFTAIGDKSATVEEYAAHFNQPSNEPARWGTSQQLLLAAKLYDKI
uniref:OTU domain-containing protein n=1 Tax=Ditylenchus dipsaci TaxID=166011 RepID=A0A915CUW5_9BILA